MEDLSLHILDIVENSIAAGASRVEITIEEDLRKDILSIEINDNGKGIPPEILDKVTDPFYTTRTTRRVGMGLSFLVQSAKEADGDVAISSIEGKGTLVKAYFRHSHIDRKPLGKMSDTMIVLIAGNPQVGFIYEHYKDGRRYLLDTGYISSQLGGVPLNDPEVINLIWKDIKEGLKDIGA